MKTLVRLLVACYTLFSALPMMGQQKAPGRDLALSLLNNVAKINTTYENKEENGFGFVVGEIKGELYIITAYHVVSEFPSVDNAEPESIKLSYYGDKSSLAKTLQVDRELDLALLVTPSPANYSWRKKWVDSGPRRDDRVRFIGKEGEWHVPTSVEEGAVEKIERDFLISAKLDVGRGSSGGPLLNDFGIIGVNIAQPGENLARSVKMEAVIDFVTENGNKPERFQLRQVPRKRIERPSYFKEVSLMGAGLGIGVWGIVMELSAQDKYSTYRTIRDPQNYAYEGTNRDDFFEKANSKHVTAQIMMYGGAIVLGAGTYWLFKHIAKDRKNTEITLLPSLNPDTNLGKLDYKNWTIGLRHRF